MVETIVDVKFDYKKFEGFPDKIQEEDAEEFASSAPFFARTKELQGYINGNDQIVSCNGTKALLPYTILSELYDSRVDSDAADKTTYIFYRLPGCFQALHLMINLLEVYDYKIAITGRQISVISDKTLDKSMLTSIREAMEGIIADQTLNKHGLLAYTQFRDHCVLKIMDNLIEKAG